jgi:hypothetical protein
MLPLFLEIAKNPSAYPEAARTVQRLKEAAVLWNQDVEDISDEEAFEILKSKDWISLQVISNEHEPLVDVAPLADFVELTGLALNENNIVSLEPLGSLVKLRRLCLDKNCIRDLGPLRTLSRLVDLDVHDNPIEDFTSLRALPSLKELEISHEQVAAFGRVGVLNNLWKLTVHGSLADLRMLPEMPSLRMLSIGECDSFVGIERFSELRNLYSHGGKAFDLAPLELLKKLTHLNLSGYEIENLAPLAKLYSLREVTLIGNKVASLEALSGLPALREVSFRNNPIEEDQIESFMATLTPWDVEFSHDGPPRTYGPEIVVVDEDTWEFYNKNPFGIEGDDGDYELLSSEKYWLAGKVESALSVDWIPEEDFDTPCSSPHARSFSFSMYNVEMIQQLRAVVDVIQRALAEARNDFIVYLMSDYFGDEVPFFMAWIYREKVVVTPEYESTVRKLLSF